MASASASFCSVTESVPCGSGAPSSSIVSISATWSPPEPETVQSSSSAAIEERAISPRLRSEEHTSELQSHVNLVCRLLLEKKKKNTTPNLNEKKNKKQNKEN